MILNRAMGILSVGPARVQLKDEAAAHIRELIVSGQVASGELLRLAPLAERVGASVTPVREALLLLAQDGWVTQEPNRGFRVSQITRRDVEDAYIVHGWVTGELTARAALAIDAGTLEDLRRIDAAIVAAGDGDAGFLEEGNFLFHDMVYATAASPRLTWFVNAAARFVPRRFWGMIPGWYEHNRTGHAPIIDALAARDAEAARSAMVDHIAAARVLLLAHLDAIGYWPGPEGH